LPIVPATPPRGTQRQIDNRWYNVLPHLQVISHHPPTCSLILIQISAIMAMSCVVPLVVGSSANSVLIRSQWAIRVTIVEQCDAEPPYLRRFIDGCHNVAHRHSASPSGPVIRSRELIVSYPDYSLALEVGLYLDLDLLFCWEKFFPLHGSLDQKCTDVSYVGWISYYSGPFIHRSEPRRAHLIDT